MLGIAAAVIVLGAMRLAAEFLVPVLLAFFISVLSYPVMAWMEKRKLPHALALTLTLLLDLSMLVGIGFLAVSLSTDFQSRWQDFYAAKLTQLSGDTLAQIEHQLRSAGFDASGFRVAFASFINIEALLKLATENLGGVLSRVTSVLKLTVLVLLMVGFMLAEGGGFARKLPGLKRVGGPDFTGLTRVTGDVQKYLVIKTVISAATGFCAWLLCSLSGLDFAVLWGLVAFALNFIPAIGSIVAAVPPMLLALIQHGFGHSAIIGIGYLAINTIFGNILEPTLQGRKFGISSIIVVLSVLFWGWLLGIAGMFLAVPLTMLVKVALDMSPELRWLSALIEQEKTMPAVAQAIVDKVTGGDSEKSGPPDAPGSKPPVS